MVKGRREEGGGQRAGKSQGLAQCWQPVILGFPSEIVFLCCLKEHLNKIST